MLGTIIKKEILEQIVSFRFYVLVAICLVLIPLSLFVSNGEYRNRIGDYNRLVQLSREKIDSTQTLELMSEAYSVDGYAPPEPLTVFAGGFAAIMPVGFESRRAGITFIERSSTDDALLSLSGTIDFLFIIQAIFSLLAVLFTFDAVCGERELGTLKTMLSNAVPRDTVILGKLTGILATMLIPFLASFAIGILLLIVLGFPLTSGDALIRIALMNVSIAVFMTVFACIGLIVSSRVERSKTSIVLLMFIWIMFVNVIPKGAGIVAQALVPVASDTVVDTQKSMLRRNLERERGTAIADMEDSLPQYLDTTPENQARNEAINEEREQLLSDVRQSYNQRINDGVAQIDDRIGAQKNRQLLSARLIAQLSPVTSFTNMFTSIAGTGTYDRERFTMAADAYQETLNQVLFRYIFWDIFPDGHMTMSIDTDKIDLANLPEFSYETSSLMGSFHAIVPDIIIFALFLIATLTGAYVSFLRYDVR